MGWIKRNLFFVIGGILTVGLLGGAGFYNYRSWNRNSAAFDTLQGLYSNLRDLMPKSGKPGPGNDKINNTETAKQQERQLRDWIQQSTNYFKPVPPIPNPANGQISSELFANALHRTLSQMQTEADDANVTLQPKYAFSFGAQLSLVKFAPGSLGPLSEQLGEVKAISEVLYAARVNSLDSVQRVRVCDDDTGTSDYLDERSVTNQLAVATPYVVTFRGFSPEIAQVLAGFARSPHGFIVCGVNVQPASGMMAGEPQPAAPASAAPMPGKGGLQTVLKEQLLRATVKIELVKLLPKN